jgi:LmbE family N-acetylglucosaminyl deacetylase
MTTTGDRGGAAFAGERAVASVLAVIAHPDDETFGLGAVLAQFAEARADVRVLCLTRGEASTLGATVDLADVRAEELRCAARRLGLGDVFLLDLPDGGLADVPPEVLDGVVEQHLGDAELLVVFEPSGVTGHPDHRAATAAAERVGDRRGLTVLEWGVAGDVAARLNAELGTSFVGLDGDDVLVDRTAQRRAIPCHDSQARDNPVLARRLALQGERERVRRRRAVSRPPVIGRDPLDRSAVIESPLPLR